MPVAGRASSSAPDGPGRLISSVVRRASGNIAPNDGISRAGSIPFRFSLPPFPRRRRPERLSDGPVPRSLPRYARNRFSSFASTFAGLAEIVQRTPDAFDGASRPRHRLVFAEDGPPRRGARPYVRAIKVDARFRRLVRRRSLPRSGGRIDVRGVRRGVPRVVRFFQLDESGARCFWIRAARRRVVDVERPRAARVAVVRRFSGRDRRRCRASHGYSREQRGQGDRLQRLRECRSRRRRLEDSSRRPS